MRFIAIILLSFVYNQNTPGCTNPDTTNYNPDANVDDGSCCIELWGECYKIP